MKKTKSLSVAKITSIADRLRKRYKISVAEPFPILAFLFELHYKGLLTIQILPDSDSLFNSSEVAKYSPIDNFIYIKEKVIRELSNKNYHANFTLAHELFHYLEYAVFKYQFEEAENVLAFEDPEWQANEFAAELLIPTDAIKNQEDLSALANKYQVSDEAIITRKLYYNRRSKRKNKIKKILLKDN